MLTETVSKRTRLLAHLGLFYAAAIWGSTFFVVKAALADIDPVIMVAYRFLLAGLILLVYLLLTGKPILAGLGKGFWLAVILWALYVPQTIGLGITTASNSGFITGLFVAFVPVLLRIIFKRKPTFLEVMASVVSLIGLWILTGGMTKVNVGDMLTLLAAFAYALHLLFADKYMKTGIDPIVINCQQFLLIGLFSVITGLIFDLPFDVGSIGTVKVVIFLAIFPTLLAFVIQMISQKFISPLRVSLIFALEPVFAGIFAWTLGGEQFVLHGAIGGFFIFVALIISGLPMRKNQIASQMKN
ncbi:MAG: DMT family transporter [FCB group bacterium]|nr:DMT family transporter [FCB group bacterium]